MARPHLVLVRHAVRRVGEQAVPERRELLDVGVAVLAAQRGSCWSLPTAMATAAILADPAAALQAKDAARALPDATAPSSTA
jgi:hypothetical protein